MPTIARATSRLINRVLAGATDIRDGEGRAVLASGTLFFLILMAVMMLRPLRDAVGLRFGVETVRVLMLVTIPVLLVAMPLFGYVIARMSRQRLIAISFRFCALTLVGFYLALAWLPRLVGEESVLVCAPAQVYVVFHSVFNLLVVSLFWALMADLFNVAESKRLFPAIAVGGTLGAVAGSTCASRVARLNDIGLSVFVLLVIAAALLEAAVWMARIVMRRCAPSAAQAADPTPIGGHWLAGVTALSQSRYILGIGVFVLLTSMHYTIYVFTQLRIVESAAATVSQRTALFANIEVWTQLATLFAQAFLVGRVMRYLGVGTALAVLPVVAIAGFAYIAASPTLAACKVFSATYRAVQNGFTNPARETLFTVLSREQKYKAKSFLDTFVFRAGDATGAVFEKLVHVSAGMAGLAAAIVPIGLAWASLAALLSSKQSSLGVSCQPDARPVG